MNSGGRGRARGRLIGLVFLALIGLLIWLSLALYNKQFTTVDTVILHTGSVGNEMHPNAQVLVRGVQVGEVRTIAADGSGATLTLAIDPAMVSRLPANVTAEMVPTTLFGQRYVDLIMPARPVARRLENGSVIRQDSSRDAIEVEAVLNNLLSELTAVQPQNLSITLTAIAQALQGRGSELGHTLVELNAYLHKMNPNLPALDNDFRELAQVSQVYSQASPDIVQALSDFAYTGRTLVAEQRTLSDLYTTVTQSSQDLNAFLHRNSGNMIGLAANSKTTLQTLERYAPEFPCTLEDLVKFEPFMNKVLGAGTDQPGLHVRVTVVEPLGNKAEPLGNYLPGRDTPVFGDNTGPHCYPVPFPGVALNDGATPASSGATGTGSAKTGTASPVQAQDSALSLVNSPEENELINELSASELGVSPRSLPGWSSLLVGPVYRGHEVRLG